MRRIWWLSFILWTGCADGEPDGTPSDDSAGESTDTDASDDSADDSDNDDSDDEAEDSDAGDQDVTSLTWSVARTASGAASGDEITEINCSTEGTGARFQARFDGGFVRVMVPWVVTASYPVDYISVVGHLFRLPTGEGENGYEDLGAKTCDYTISAPDGLEGVVDVDVLCPGDRAEEEVEVSVTFDASECLLENTDALCLHVDEDPPSSGGGPVKPEPAPPLACGSLPTSEVCDDYGGCTPGTASTCTGDMLCSELSFFGCWQINHCVPFTE